MSEDRLRLDRLLVERGLVRSRTRAQALVTDGLVTVDGVVADKPSAEVAVGADLQVTDDGWVSRAAHKLIGALDACGVTVHGRALDAGASTGGFTQVLLSRGVTQVYAVDVGHGQLDDSLREDPRVVVREGLNLRDLTLADVGGEPVDVVTADVSFISLTLILEQLLGVLAPDGVAICLVKPQFELGKKTRKVKGGVVRSESLRSQALDGVLEEAHRLGWRPLWQGDSVLPGQDGNVEQVVVLVKTHREAGQVSTEHTRTVAVWQHATRSDAARDAAEFSAALAAQGLRVVVPAEDLAALQEVAADVALEPLGDGDDVELCVIFGGDGSILRAAEWAQPRRVPLLGVNLGHIGFLAELDRSEQGDLVDAVVQRRYDIEERSTLAVRACSPDGGTVWESFAINEVSVEKSARERMLEVLVRIDDLPLSRWGCDGVLVATPTGSTAYAFSAGGPVLWPDVDAMLVVPISAHALFNRPVVLSPRSRVDIELVEPSATEGVVWCDGRRSTPLRGGTMIEVTAGQQPLLLARLTEQPFTSRLQRKFGLRVEGWRGAAEGEIDPGEHGHAD